MYKSYIRCYETLNNHISYHAYIMYKQQIHLDNVDMSHSFINVRLLKGITVPA